MSDAPSRFRPRAMARLDTLAMTTRLTQIRQAVERSGGQSDYVERILRDIEFLRENNRAGQPIAGLDERYRRWPVSSSVYIIYFVERPLEEIVILDIGYVGGRGNLR